MIRRWKINKNKCFESEVVFTLPFNRASVVNVTFRYIPIRLRLLWIIHLCLFTPSVRVTPTGRLAVTNHPSVFRRSFFPHSVTVSIVTAVATRVFVINSSCVVVRPRYFKWESAKQPVKVRRCREVLWGVVRPRKSKINAGLQIVWAVAELTAATVALTRRRYIFREIVRETIPPRVSFSSPRCGEPRLVTTPSLTEWRCWETFGARDFIIFAKINKQSIMTLK